MGDGRGDDPVGGTVAFGEAGHEPSAEGEGSIPSGGVRAIQYRSSPHHTT
jgi:hypothetical protein